MCSDGDIDANSQVGGGHRQPTAKAVGPTKPVVRARQAPGQQCDAPKLIAGTEARMMESNCTGSAEQR